MTIDERLAAAKAGASGTQAVQSQSPAVEGSIEARMAAARAASVATPEVTGQSTPPSITPAPGIVKPSQTAKETGGNVSISDTRTGTSRPRRLAGMLRQQGYIGTPEGSSPSDSAYWDAYRQSDEYINSESEAIRNKVSQLREQIASASRVTGEEAAQQRQSWQNEVDALNERLRKLRPSLAQRAGNTALAAGETWLGSMLETPGYVLDAAARSDKATDRRFLSEEAEQIAAALPQLRQELLYVEDAQERTRLEKQISELEGILQQDNERMNDEGMSYGENVRNKATELSQRGTERLAKATLGAGTGEKLLVNAAIATGQMGLDAAASLGVNAMVPMMIRSFGGAAQEARQRGLSMKQQAALGLSSAATEYFSEKLFGGNPVYDTDAGLLDELIYKVSRNERLLEALSSAPAEMLYEGFEEIVSDLLNPIAEYVVTGAYDPATLDELIESGVTGVLTAIIAQGGQSVVNQAMNARARQDESPTAFDAIEQINREAQETQQHVQSQRQAAENARTQEIFDGVMEAVNPEGKSRNLNSAENHIDNRSMDEVGSRSVKAFSFDHPELREYYVQAAQTLINDAENSATNRGMMYSRATGADGRRIGQHYMQQSSSLLDAARNEGYSLNEIMEAARRIINDDGQENVAAAKRIELLLDEMLTNGYTTSYGEQIAPNSAYIQAKGQINGGSSEAELRVKQYLDSFALTDALEGPPTEAELAERNAEVERIRAEYAGRGDGLGAADAGFAGETLDYEDWKAANEPFVGFPTMDIQDVAARDRNFHRLSNENFQSAWNTGRLAERIPLRDFQGHLTSKQAQTLINSGITSESMAESLKSAAANGAFSYMEITDNAAQQRAAEKIQADGYMSALANYKHDVLQGKVSKDITTMGITLYNNAVAAGDSYTAMDIASLMIQNSRSAAQALQASRMLNKLGPDASLYMAVQSIENIQNQLVDRYGDRAPDLEIDRGLLQDYRDAIANGDEASKEEAWGLLAQSIADQIPADWREKFNNWRYLSMLGNPRTHIRNIAGNLGFAPVRLIKQGFKVGLERVALGKTGEGSKRTTAILNLASKEDQARLRAAWADYSDVEGIIQSGGKYNETSNDIEDRRTIYKFKPLETVRKANTVALDVEDTWFSRPAYAEALASFLKARGIDGSDYLSGNISEELKADAQSHAIKEAQKATYRDTNQFSELISSLGRVGRGKNATNAAKAAGILIEGTLPFKKTPANILVRAVEYSPLEFIQMLGSDIRKVQNGSLSTSEMLDHIASGLTGTGLVALGALLTHLGILHGGEDQDEEQAAFDAMRGKQEYSIDVGDRNVTLDWLAPEALPFFVGNALYNAIAKEGDGGTFSRFVDGLLSISEPMLNMSMLSSINDLIDNASYADNRVWGIIGQIATSYLQQFVPTLFGQIERTTEAERNTTFINRESELSSDTQYTIAKIMNKLPGEFEQIPYIDAWGRSQGSGAWWERGISNFLNPSYVRQDASTENDSELQRLKDAGFDGVFPERVSQSTKVDQQYMTADEYVNYLTIRGQNSLQYVSELLATPEYQQMSDVDKADAIKEMYSRSKGEAENAVRAQRQVEEKRPSTKEQKERALNAGDYAEYQVYKNAVKGVNDGDVTDADASTMDTLLRDYGKLNEQQTDLLEDLDNFKKLKACNDAGVGTKAFYGMLDVYKSATTPTGYKSTEAGNASTWAKMMAILDSDYSDKEKLVFINAMSGRKDPFNSLFAAKSYYQSAMWKAKEW